MTTTLIRDATIVTADAARRVLYDAAIAVDDTTGRILDLGPSDEVAAKHPGAQTIEGRGRAVFPGLVNCHTHLTATVSRGVQEDFGFPTTLQFPQPVTAFLSS